jgi:hypothetical protein
MSDDICKVNVSLPEVEGNRCEHVVLRGQSTNSLERNKIDFVLVFMGLPPDRAVDLVRGSTQKFHETCRSLKRLMYENIQVLYPQLIAEARSAYWLSGFLFTLFPVNSECDEHYISSDFERTVTVTSVQKIDDLFDDFRGKWGSMTHEQCMQINYDFSIQHRGLAVLSRALHYHTDDGDIVRLSLYILRWILCDERVRDAVGDDILRAFIKCTEVYPDDALVLTYLFDAAGNLTSGSKHVHNFEWARVFMRFIYGYMIEHVDDDEHCDFEYPIIVLYHFAQDRKALEEIHSMNFVSVVAYVMEKFNEDYSVLDAGATLFYNMTVDGTKPEFQDLVMRCRSQIRASHGALNVLRYVQETYDGYADITRLADKVLDICRPDSQE